MVTIVHGSIVCNSAAEVLLGSGPSAGAQVLMPLPVQHHVYKWQCLAKNTTATHCCAVCVTVGSVA